MSEAALLQAIIDSPDDDSLRLVYADYLEERGEPERATFIRVQVELALLPQADERRASLEARERELLASCKSDWGPDLRELCDETEFVRGFVGYVRLEDQDFAGRDGEFPLFGRLQRGYEFDAEKFAARLEQIGRLTPLEYVTVTTFPSMYAALIVHTTESVQALLKSPAVSNLRLLDVRYNTLTDPARALLRSHYGERVRFEE